MVSRNPNESCDEILWQTKSAMESRQLFLISIARSEYQLQEKEKRSNQYLGTILALFGFIWLCDALCTTVFLQHETGHDCGKERRMSPRLA